MMMIQNRHHRKSNHNNYRREAVDLVINNDHKQQQDSDDVAAVAVDASDNGNVKIKYNYDEDDVMGGGKKDHGVVVVDIINDIINDSKLNNNNNNNCNNKLEKQRVRQRQQRQQQQQRRLFHHQHRNRKNVILVVIANNGLMIICSICLIVLWTFHHPSFEFMTTTTATSSSSSSPAVQLQLQLQKQNQKRQQPKNGESKANRSKKKKARTKSSSSSSSSSSSAYYYFDNNNNNHNNNTTTTTTTSSLMIGSYTNNDDGPPPSLIVHGKRSKYTPCPIQYRKHAYVQGNKKADNYNIHRAFQSQGWFVTSDPNNLYSPQQHIIYQKSKINNNESNNNKTDIIINFLQPYQRYSRLTQFIRYVDSKDGFVAGFRKYQQKYEEKSSTSKNQQKHNNNNNKKKKKKKKKGQQQQQQQQQQQVQQRSLDNSSSNMNMNDTMNNNSNNNNTISTTTNNTNTKNKIKNLIYFLPETYRLGIESDRVAFHNALEEERINGMYKPWVLKQTRKSRGRGVEILPPNSPKLYEAMERTKQDKSNNYIVQAYVCNELVWYGGEKFDLRFYWMVASIDPLIVLFHDGFVRVADSLYNETNFLNTKQHLTNTAINNGGRGRGHGYHGGGGGGGTASSAVAGSSSSSSRPNKNNSGGGGGDDGGSNSSIIYNNEEDVLADALWERIRQHYKENEVRLSKRISNSIQNKKESTKTKTTTTTTTTTTEDPSIRTIFDPVKHVRNQLKDAISTTAAAFKDVLTADVRRKNTTKITAENRFAIYGCDFIIDADLDVYYVEAQNGPQMKDTHDFRIDLYRKMLRPMVNLVEEIAIKQQTDAKANLLPLQNLGEWEIVYAGSKWRYKYQGYQRNLKDKKGCSS